MCGLVGVAGHIWSRHQDAFNDLLVIDQIRGTDGTGVFGVGPDKSVDVLRYPGDAMAMLDHKRFATVTSTYKRVVAGHNRKMTLGRRSVENTHPFEFSRVIGMHNGTLQASAKRALVDHDKYETDSEALIATINFYLLGGATPEEAMKQTIGRIEEDSGAWALVLYFKKENKLGFLRNKERPLYYCLCEDKAVIMWASEVWMLHGVCHRNKIKMDTNPMAITENSLLLFNVTTGNDAFKAPSRTPVKAKEKPPYVFQPTVETQRIGPNTRTTSANVVRLPPINQHSFPNDNKKGHYKPPYKTHYGDIINKARFQDFIEKGGSCVYCNTNVPTYGEEVLFLRPTPDGAPQYLCETCLNDDEIYEIAKAAR